MEKEKIVNVTSKEDVEKLQKKHYRYRIRKLTPRECLRLMAVRDSDIDKMIAAGISESQLYKLAGNSIVVDCLVNGIFKNLFIESDKPQDTLF